MPDPLTDEERRAIAAYAGPVVALPYRAERPSPWLWNGRNLSRDKPKGQRLQEAKARFWVEYRKGRKNGQA